MFQIAPKPFRLFGLAVEGPLLRQSTVYSIRGVFSLSRLLFYELSALPQPCIDFSMALIISLTGLAHSPDGERHLAIMVQYMPSGSSMGGLRIAQFALMKVQKLW